MTALFMDNSGFAPGCAYRYDDEDSCSDDDSVQSTIKLQLKKPKAWNWELTTSKSSPNIAFPRILLCDDQGEVLADARDADCVFRGSCPKYGQSSETRSGSTSNAKHQSSSSSSIKSKKKRRSSTTNLSEINENLEDLVDHLKTQGIPYKLRNSSSPGPFRNRAGSNERKPKRPGSYCSQEIIPEDFLDDQDLHTNETNEPPSVVVTNVGSCGKLEKLADTVSEVPIWVYSEKGLLKRDLNAKEFDHLNHLRKKDTDTIAVTTTTDNGNFSTNKRIQSSGDLSKIEKFLTPLKEVRFDLQKSKSATDVLERGKRKAKRSSNSVPSKFSGSILERMSAFKRHSSSTESQDVEVTTVDHGPRYFLRTSNAGTLVVCEESFRNRKVRRRPRSISKISENDKNDLSCSREKVVHGFEYPGPAGPLQTAPEICNGNGDVADGQLYDQVISKLDNLISKVSLKRNEPAAAPSNLTSSQKVRLSSGNQFLSVTKDIDDGSQRDQSVASDFKVKRRRKLKELRRCVSAGTVCLSSDEDQDIVAAADRYSRTRNKKRAYSKTSKGDQILTLNSNYSNIQPIGASPTAIGIIDDTSDEILLRFVRRLESFKQQKGLQTDETDSGKIDENRNYQFREEEEEENKALGVFGDIYNTQNGNRQELKENEQRPKVCKDGVRSGDAISAKCPGDYLAKAIKSKGGCLDDDNAHNLDLEEDLCRNVASDDKIGSDCNKENFLADSNNMGSNVSRSTSKGLSGRRTQSSGNLYTNKNGDAYCPTPNGNPNDKKRTTKTTNESSQGVKYHTIDRRDVPDYPLESCPQNLIMPPMSGVSKEDRNKFCGSLPNHLDNDCDNVEKDTNPNHIQVESYIKTEGVEYVTVTPNKPQQNQLQHQQQPKQVQHSPYNNSISEKETASTSSESSTFKINQDRPDIQLKLRLTRSNFDPSCDQGYGSERSPEDELPPLLPHLTPSPYFHQQTLIPDMTFQNGNPYAYNFITKDCTFTVQITKGPRGLGLSISGGIDSNSAFPGLIRIKRLFPHQAAWSTGKLQPGDIILEANDVPLTGLTNYEALEVLRTMPSEVILLICRPCDEQYKKLSPPTEPPRPPQRTQQQGTQTMPEEAFPLDPVPPILTNFNGEFEIIMVKQQGSLGFTLRKEDESVLGHYVRALVREPATTDGRIKPGDKIVAVNDVPLSPMTHEQAVIFLRQAADTVKLRLYRDEAQTPVAAMSPTSSENKTILCGSGKKAYLRPEAINLLSDLAYKKQNTPGDSTESSLVSSNTSPRRLKRGNKHSSATTTTSQSEQDVTDSKSSGTTAQYIVSSQATSVCSDSEQSVASQCSFIVQTVETSDTETLNTPDVERPNRPNFLNLSGPAGSAPVPCRKAKLQFSVPTNAYDLNNLDNDALDAPRYTEENELERPLESQLPENHEFTSLPCETFLIACKTESDLKNEANFSYKNPMYQSDHVTVSQLEDMQQNATKRAGNKSLLKWKGVVFSPDEEAKETTEGAGDGAAGAPGASAPTLAGAPASTTDSSCSATAATSSTPATERHFDLKEFPAHPEGYKIITVELNRGWNSRLGFSLQSDPITNKTVIRAVYSDSVAARDGRLRVGDQLLMVNEESVENMPTQQVIELLRLLRGSIGITVLRKEPDASSSGGGK